MRRGRKCKGKRRGILEVRKEVFWKWKMLAGGGNGKKGSGKVN